MSWIDELPRWQKAVSAVVILLGLTGALLVWVPTPFQMDAEASEMQQQQQSAQGCGAVYQIETQIMEAEMQLLNPTIPDWYKDELRRKLPMWRETVRRMREQYECVEWSR